MTKGFPWWMLLAGLLALGLRSVQLERRPMHNDEANNALKIRDLWEGHGYRYDPNEFHGPTLAYSTLLWEKLTLAGDFARFTEIRLRSLTVVFGVGLVLLLFLVADGLGRQAALAAAFLTAVSPVLVYYSRDYIHETLFVFFIFLALASAWRYSQTGKIAWILLAGAAIGLTQATKETFVFNLAAVMGALLLNEGLPRAAPAFRAAAESFLPRPPRGGGPGLDGRRAGPVLLVLLQPIRSARRRADISDLVPARQGRFASHLRMELLLGAPPFLSPSGRANLE